MIRTEHRAALWVAAVLLASCNSADRGAAGGAPLAQPQAAVTPPQVSAAVDATRPNKVLDPASWSDPKVKAAYAAARKHAAVLEQLYCYCHCKENIGHRALIECYETDHASMCDVCMNEAMIAQRMTDDGRSPADIQKAIDTYYKGS